MTTTLNSSWSRNSQIVVAGAIVLLVLLRVWQIAAFAPRYSDTTLYFSYVLRGVDGGQPAYRAFPIEYPPVAYWAMATPRVVGGQRITAATMNDKSIVQRSYAGYATAYRGLMFVFELASLVLLIDLLRRRQPAALAWAVWTYVIVSTLLVHVVLDRLDMGLWLFIVAWAYTRCRAEDAPDDVLWRKLSYLILGLSIAYKLLTVVVVPFVLLADWQQARRQSSVAFALVVWCAVGVVAPLLVHFPFAGLSPLKFLAFHGERGIEIESTYASLLLAMRSLGVHVETKSASGSIDLASPLSPILAKASTWITLAALALLGLAALRLGAKFDSRRGTQFGLVALLVTLVFAKVLSAQFFVFLLPAIILLAAETETNAGRWIMALACIAMAACTTAVFPYLWFASDPQTGAPLTPNGLVPTLHVLPSGLLILRNALFVAVVARLAWLVVRNDASSQATPSAIAAG